MPNGEMPRRTCGTMEVNDRILRERPEYRVSRRAAENNAFLYARLGRSPARTAVTVIPMVVHVVVNPSVPEENISDEQIRSQIPVLNEDFRKRNADISSIPDAFAPVAADARVEFELASTDPNGNPTNGITRTETTMTSFTDNDAVKSAATGGADPWPSDRYLNVWVCGSLFNSDGDELLGYAQYPSLPPETDGIVITHTAFGTTGTAAAPFHLGRTATHEIGHWLNLQHIWGRDETGCSDSDFVDDTPNQDGPNYGKPTFPSGSCSNGTNGDLFVDYMDYVDDDVMVMFTAGQVTRMHATLDNERLSIGTQRPVLTSPRLLSHTPIGVVTRSTGHLDIITTDLVGVIRTAAWQPDFTDGWHGWWQINLGLGFPGSPVHIVSRDQDKLDAFVIGLDRRIYTAAWEPSFTDWWRGWWEINGGRAEFAAHATAVSRAPDKLDVFVVGLDQRVYTAAWEPADGENWRGWWPIEGVRVLPASPVHCIARSRDKLDIFVTDVDGVIRTAAWDPMVSAEWRGWWEINGGRAAPGAPVTVASRSEDKLDVFVVGLDQRVYTAAWEPADGENWRGWWPIEGVRVPPASPVHCIVRSRDKLDIFVTDVDGVIRTAAWDPMVNAQWRGWWEINGGRAAPGAPVTVASRSEDKLDVFVVGLDQRVYTAAWEPADGENWRGWWPLGE